MQLNVNIINFETDIPSDHVFTKHQHSDFFFFNVTCD